MTPPDRVAALAADLRSAPVRIERPTSVEAIMRRRSIPGLGLAIVADGAIEWAGGWGVRDSGRGDPVTARTLFQAGSISKPVAALAALRLVADRHLNLDEDVNGRLVGWRVPHERGWQPRITVRQLLSHTGGLTVHGFPGYRRDVAAPTLVDVLDGRGNTDAVRVRTLPGFQFSYSGGGYCVLQQLLVDLTGEPFPALARRVVLEPLGMADSTYEQPLPRRLYRQAATGHRTGGSPVQGAWHVYPEMAAAGLWTTPTDLARVVVALQTARAGAARAYLPRELIDELLTPQAANVAWGLGFAIDGAGRDLRFRHGGDDQGFVAWLAGYAERGFGAVAMSNSDSGFLAIEPLLGAVARAYGWPGYPDAGEPPLQAPSGAEVTACVGDYASTEGYLFRVERSGDALVLVVPGQPPVELAPVSKTEWHAVPLAVRLTFRLGRNGRATRVRLSQEAEYVKDVDAVRAG